MKKRKKEINLLASHLKKAYYVDSSHINVLADLSFESSAGITGIIGPSGCGKTTLLKILAGIESPDGGTVERDGGEIGFVFQENRLLPWKTVEENLRFVEKENDPAWRNQVLQMLDLSEKKDAYPHELSGGMQRRCAIARALINKPDYLFMDEPFTGLDKNLVEELTQDLKRIEEEQGMTVVVVSHQEEYLRSLCHSIVSMSSLEA